MSQLNRDGSEMKDKVMPGSANECLDVDQYKRFLLGHLAPSDVVMVTEHLGTCDACAQKCGGMELSEFPFVASLQRAQKNSHVAIANECDQMIRLTHNLMDKGLQDQRYHDASDTQASNLESTDGADPLCATIPPSQLGRYSITELLGRGGMGSVYEAFDERLQRKVAIKFPHQSVQANPSARKRFQMEARAAASIHHPNVCSVLDADEFDGLCYLTMPLLSGQSLSSRLRQAPRLRIDEVITIVVELCRGLEAVHGGGIIHRDIKPANIFLQTNGTVTLMDFGLALSEGVDDRLTQSGSLIGTPSYFAPEQARGDGKSVGPLTDLYAVGTILYELLTGAPPYVGLFGEVIGHILHTPVPPLRSLYPDCDASLICCCMKSIAKQPEDRFQSVRDFRDALETWRASGVRIEPITEDSSKRTARSWIIALGVFACVGIAFVIFKMQTPWGELKLELDPQASPSEDKSHGVVAQELDSNIKFLSREAVDQFAVAHASKILLGPGDLVEDVDSQLPLSANHRISFSGDSQVFALLGDGPSVSIWNVQSSEQLAKFPLPKFDTSLALSPDGKRLLTTGGGWRVRVWDIASSREMASMTGHNNWINTVRFDPSQNWVASTSKDRTLRVYDLLSHTERWSVNVGTWPRSLAIAAQSNQIATGCNDGSIRYWDVEKGASRGSIQASNNAILELYFGADDKYLVALDAMWEMSVRRAVEGDVLWRATLLKETSIALSYDGALICLTTPDGALQVLSLSQGTSLWKLSPIGEGQHWKAVGFSRDNALVYALSNYGFLLESQLKTN